MWILYIYRVLSRYMHGQYQCFHLSIPRTPPNRPLPNGHGPSIAMRPRQAAMQSCMERAPWRLKLARNVLKPQIPWDYERIAIRDNSYGRIPMGELRNFETIWKYLGLWCDSETMLMDSKCGNVDGIVMRLWIPNVGYLWGYHEMKCWWIALTGYISCLKNHRIMKISLFEGFQTTGDTPNHPSHYTHWNPWFGGSTFRETPIWMSMDYWGIMMGFLRDVLEHTGFLWDLHGYTTGVKKNHLESFIGWLETS